MTTIADCLAAFSVAAMINTLEAEGLAREAIDRFLQHVGDHPGGQLAALHELYTTYAELALNSTAALAIKADLERRIVEVASPHIVEPTVPHSLA